jgi:hypothetical protein
LAALPGKNKRMQFAYFPHFWQLRMLPGGFLEIRTHATHLLIVDAKWYRIRISFFSASCQLIALIQN